MHPDIPTSGRMRHRIVSITALLLGLLVGSLVAVRLGGDLPALSEIRSEARTAGEHPFGHLLSRPDLAYFHQVPDMVDDRNPFYTDHFKPPPKPAPPPKPTMKQVEVLYQGWYESSSKELEAFVLIDGNRFDGTAESALGGDFKLLEIQSDRIKIQSKDDQIHEIPFNQVTRVPIPIP